MGLASDIKSAKGHISNTPQAIYFTGSGYAPAHWFGDDAVDGDAAPWSNVAVGSVYIYKPDETSVPFTYQKTAANGADADWVQLRAGLQVKELPISLLTTGEHDTGWDLPAKAVVLDVFVDVTTLEATATTKTIDVGLLSSESGGNADGFLDGVSTATPAAIRRGVPTITAGGSETYFASTTRGVLLATLVAGSDSAGDVGTYFEFPHIANSVTAKSVTYTLGSAHTELAGNIYVVYLVAGQ